MHKCKYCNKEYKTIAPLNQHLKKKHPEQINYLEDAQKDLTLSIETSGIKSTLLETTESETTETVLTNKQKLIPIFKHSTDENMNLSDNEITVLSDVYFDIFKRKINTKCKWDLIAAFVTLYKKYN